MTIQVDHPFNNFIMYVQGQGGEAVAVNDLAKEVIDGNTWGGSGNDSLIFEENFGGTRYHLEGNDNIYHFPTGAGTESWGGFALLGYDGMYPLNFENGATISFTAKVVDPSVIPDPITFDGEQAFSNGSIDFSEDTESPYKWSAHIDGMLLMKMILKAIMKMETIRSFFKIYKLLKFLTME